MKQYSRWNPPVRYTAFIIVFIISGICLWYMRSILEPLIVAAFIAYLIHPAVNYLTQRTRFSRTAAVNSVFVITLIFFIGTPSLLTPLFFDEFKQIIADLFSVFDQFIGWLMQPNILPGIPLDFTQLANKLSEVRSSFLSSLPEQAFQILGKTSLGALWVIIILVAVYLFLAQWPRLRNSFIDSFPQKYKPELEELYQRVRAIWMNYLRGQLLLMVIVGIAFSIAWVIIGLPFALVLGILAGLLTLIPDVGPAIAAVLAWGVALLEGSNWGWMPASHLLVSIIVVAVYFLLIGIKNFWLRPHILGKSVHMNEAFVFIIIILSTVLWGILGALLVVPVMATVLVVGDYLRRRILDMSPFPPTEPFVRDGNPTPRFGKIRERKMKEAQKKD